MEQQEPEPELEEAEAEQLTPEQVDEYWTRLAQMKKQFEAFAKSYIKTLEQFRPDAPNPQQKKIVENVRRYLYVFLKLCADTRDNPKRSPSLKALDGCEKTLQVVWRGVKPATIPMPAWQLQPAATHSRDGTTGRTVTPYGPYGPAPTPAPNERMDSDDTAAARCPEKSPTAKYAESTRLAWTLVCQARTMVDGARKGRLQIVEQELSIGGDPNCKDDTGYTPLIRAAEEGHIAIVKTLINHGAHVDTVGDFKTPLGAAVSRGHVGCARLLLDNGAQIDLRPEASGQTPLSDAAKFGQAECVNLLLEYKADPRATDTTGRTALMMAAFMGSRESVQVILEAGAEIEARCQMERTAFLWACAAGPKGTESVQELLKAGCDVSALDKNGASWQGTHAQATCEQSRKAIATWCEETSERRRAQAEQELLAMLDAEEKANGQTNKRNKRKKKKKKKKGAKTSKSQPQQPQPQQTQAREQRGEEQANQPREESHVQEACETVAGHGCNTQHGELACSILDEIQPEPQAEVLSSDVDASTVATVCGRVDYGDNLQKSGEECTQLALVGDLVSKDRPAATSRELAPDSHSLDRLLATSMTEWTSSQLVAWATLQNLPEVHLLQSIFVEDDIDGEEFVELKPKMLRRLLKKAGSIDPDGSTQVILAQRVDTMMQQRGKHEEVVSTCLPDAGATHVQQKQRAAEVKLFECPFCFEEYTDSGDSGGLLVPRILTKCGHTAWVTTNVPHGKAASLATNFSLLAAMQ